MKLLDILTFAGHLHPLVVHLPIGFLLLAFLFDLLTYRKEYAAYKPAVSIILLAGFVAAVMACVFGYVLSLTGDYDADTLGSHKIAGIVLAIVAGLLYLLTTAKVRARLPLPARLFSVLVLGLVVLTSYAGHQGGSLTHGNNYLTLATLTETKRPKPTSADEAYIFEDVVHPILIQKCGQCHQAGKLKGRFSVQTLQTLLKGGKTGPAIVAGHIGESELYKRITLSPLDEKFMPADGKTPLTAAETAVIQWWIAKAGAVEHRPLATLNNKDSIKPQVAAILGLGDSGDMGASAATGLTQHINPEIPPNLDNTFIESLRAKGFMVRVMLQKPVMLDVTLPANAGKKMADIKDDLLHVAKNIVWLNLSRNNFNDGDMAILKQLPNLEKLRLENNPIGDGVVGDLTVLQHLDAVNLNETNITQAGLDALTKNTAIKRVYSWKGK